MLRRAQLCHSMLSVCLSVCLSVITYGRLEFWEIISRPIKASARADPNMGDLVQREHRKIGVEWGGVRRTKNLQYLQNGARYIQGYCDGLLPMQAAACTPCTLSPRSVSVYQCCCPRGKSLSSRILEDQFSSPCPRPRPWSSSPCPRPRPRKFKSSKIFED